MLKNVYRDVFRTLEDVAARKARLVISKKSRSKHNSADPAGPRFSMAKLEMLASITLSVLSMMQACLGAVSIKSRASQIRPHQVVPPYMSANSSASACWDPSLRCRHRGLKTHTAIRKSGVVYIFSIRSKFWICNTLIRSHSRVSWC